MSEFKGIVAATITPFTSEDELDEAVFGTILESNIKAGVDGFWISGGTGESVLLTEEEVIRTAVISAELCKGRAKSIVHVVQSVWPRALETLELMPSVVSRLSSIDPQTRLLLITTVPLLMQQICLSLSTISLNIQAWSSQFHLWRKW